MDPGDENSGGSAQDMSKQGSTGTGRGWTNRNGSRWGTGRLQVDLRRRNFESGRRRHRGRLFGGLLCFCKRGGHTLGGRACRRSPGRHRRITPGRAKCIVTVAKRAPRRVVSSVCGTSNHVPMFEWISVERGDPQHQPTRLKTMFAQMGCDPLSTSQNGLTSRPCMIFS